MSRNLDAIASCSTVDELARELKVHPCTIRRAIKRGDIKTIRFCGIIRIPKREVVRLLTGDAQ